MTLAYHIPSVWTNYCIWHNRTIILDSNKNLFLIEPGSKPRRLHEGRFQAIQLINDEIWAFEYEHLQTIVINLVTEDVTTLDYVVGLSINAIAQDQIYSTLRKASNRFFGVVDIQKKNIRKEFPIDPTDNRYLSAITPSHLILVNDTQIVCKTTTNFDDLWSLDIAQTLPQNQVRINKLAIADDTLIALCDTDLLIAVDVSSGVIRWQRQMPIRIITPPTIKEGKMYWLSFGENPVYQIIDINTGEIETQLTPNNEITARLIFAAPAVTNNRLLLTSVSSHEIIEADKQTLSIIDITKLEKCKNRIPIDYSPSIQGDLVYQLDGDNTLHVFNSPSVDI